MKGSKIKQKNLKLVVLFKNKIIIKQQFPFVKQKKLKKMQKSVDK